MPAGGGSSGPLAGAERHGGPAVPAAGGFGGAGLLAAAVAQGFDASDGTLGDQWATNGWAMEVG